MSNSNVTISNCRGYGLDPGVAGIQRGYFFHGYQIGSLTVEHNYIEATNFGIDIDGTNGWSLSGPVLIRYNQAKNLDGAPSDGTGGRILTGASEVTDWGNHFAIITNYQNIQTAEIAWNEIESDPTTSWIGDVINIYSSSGTPSTPILIHDNYIQGGYPAVPTATLAYAAGITMDGSAADTAATATAHVRIYNNQVVAHSSSGISLAAGHDNEAYGNRVVSNGQFADGSWYFGWNGINVVDCACYEQPPSVYFNNFAHDNTVGFLYEYVQGGALVPPPVRQDYLLTNCAGGASGPSSLCTNNSSLPDPITTATEANEFALWQQKLASNSISVGPTVAVENYEGLWWAAPPGSESGWGINFAHQGDIIFATWFTYDLAGKGWWLTMTAPETLLGTYSGTLYTTTGPAFNSVPFNPAQVKVTQVGTGTLSFGDENDATFAYTVNGNSQTKNITRQVFGPLPVCSTAAAALSTATNYTDLWWAAPAGVESGWGINFAQEGNTIFGTWFTYALDGSPLVVVGHRAQHDTRCVCGHAVSDQRTGVQRGAVQPGKRWINGGGNGDIHLQRRERRYFRLYRSTGFPRLRRSPARCSRVLGLRVSRTLRSIFSLLRGRKMNTLVLRIVFTAIALMGLPASVLAVPVLWDVARRHIQPLGGTASGSFIYDADTNTYSAINITTTTGSVLKGATYAFATNVFVCAAPCSGGADGEWESMDLMQ